MFVSRSVAHLVVCLCFVALVPFGSSAEPEQSNLYTTASVEKIFRDANQAYRENASQRQKIFMSS